MNLSRVLLLCTLCILQVTAISREKDGRLECVSATRPNIDVMAWSPITATNISSTPITGATVTALAGYSRSLKNENEEGTISELSFHIVLENVNTNLVTVKLTHDASGVSMNVLENLPVNPNNRLGRGPSTTTSTILDYPLGAPMIFIDSPDIPLLDDDDFGLDKEETIDIGGTDLHIENFLY